MKALEIAYGRAVYPASQVLQRVRQEPFLTSYAKNSISQNEVKKQERPEISSLTKSGILYV